LQSTRYGILRQGIDENGGIDMGHLARSITITAIVHLALCASCAGQVDDAGMELDKSQVPPEETELDDAGFGIHFQVGALYRFATSVEDEQKQTYLVTGDLCGLRWSRKESSWGLGVHFALDDSGYRLGVKGLWRTPLKKGSWMYFQLSPGVYVGSTDDTYDPKLPGFFFEAELGLAREFALVVAAEVLPYENRTVGWSQSNSWDYGTPIKESGTATALFAGAKVGQEGAAIATVIGAIIGIAVLASFAASGGVM
jgi:hypothetical protein